MQKLGDFKLPQFFNYPPYFTLQPVRDTREKQLQLWKELILDYCKTQKIYTIGLEENFPLFSNPVIERSLNNESRETFLSALVSEGRAEWLDKGHKKCLILWHRIQDWAEIILQFVKDYGLEDGVMTIEDIRLGIESRGTAATPLFVLQNIFDKSLTVDMVSNDGMSERNNELHGVDRTILIRALKILESKGKAAIFKGTSTDDEGVKFSV